MFKAPIPRMRQALGEQLEDERLAALTATDLGLPLSKYDRGFPGAHGSATVIWHLDYNYDHVPRRENVSHRSNARARLGEASRARSGDHRRRTYWITSSV